MKIEDIKVGDKYYCYTGYGYRSIVGVYTVERITKTQLVLNNGDRLRITPSDMSYLKKVGSDSWSNASYYLETEEIKKEWELQKAREKAGKFHTQLSNCLGKLSIDELKEFIEVNSKFVKP